MKKGQTIFIGRHGYGRIIKIRKDGLVFIALDSGIDYIIPKSKLTSINHFIVRGVK